MEGAAHPMPIPVNEFIQQREAEWKRLETLIQSRRGHAPLPAREVHDLGKLYRAITSDLALARRDFPQQQVTLYLNQLLTRTHAYLYQRNNNNLSDLLETFRTGIPQVFRQTAWFTLAGFLLFLIPSLVGFWLAYSNPDVAQPLGLEAQRVILAENDIWTDIPPEERSVAASAILTNNIRVALLAFAGGVTFGLFTVYVLVTNGLTIGAIFGLAAHYGMGGALFDFVIGHGVIELSVIFMAGGAGLQLGWALLNPGPYTRKDALVVATRRALLLAVASIPLLIIAGLIEGFSSPSALPTLVKIGVGLVSGGLMFAWLLGAGRKPAVQDSVVADEDAEPVPA
jgi:uncharacterized membrane protein SpoIIM required for sporulation